MARALKACGSLAVLFALVVGVPALLAATIGDPLTGWADLTAGDLTDEVIIDLLAAVVWIAWAQFALSVVVEGVAAARNAPRRGYLPLVPSISQQLAHTLIASVLLIGTGAVAMATPLNAFASTPAYAPTTQNAAHQPVGTVTSPVADHHTTRQVDALATTYVVPADGNGPDTYWDIAAAYCGGGEHWTQIWQLNHGRTQHDGAVMNDPGLLRPGWTVLLPTHPATRSEAHDEVVTVRDGDTLSAIAQQHGLANWHQAWEASQDMPEPGGRRFHDPDLIRPGWTVRIPAESRPVRGQPAAPAHPTAPAKPVRPSAPATTAPVPPPAEPTAPSTPAPASPSIRPPTTQPGPEQSRPTISPASTSNLSMVAFAGGGALLAGLSLAALLRHRRRQFRWRSAGRTIASAPPRLVNIERHLLVAGSEGTADVTWLDRALRSLAEGVEAGGAGSMPDVIAVCMTDDTIELILGSAHPDPPALWAADEAATRWSIQRNDELPYDASAGQFQLAPFPTLVSVGDSAAGEHYLVDLERVGSLSLTGDPERCANLARFMAAELAHNTWSELLQVTLVGIGQEMAGINPERLTYADDLAKAVARAHDQLESAIDDMRGNDGDLPMRRSRNAVSDSCTPHVLLVASHLPDDGDDLHDLLSALREHRPRAAVALVLAEETDTADDVQWKLSLDARGMLQIPALGVELIAHQIPLDEAADLAELLALAASTRDEPMPASRGTQPWDACADAAGGIREASGESGDPNDAAPPAEEPAFALAAPTLDGARTQRSTVVDVRRPAKRGPADETEAEVVVPLESGVDDRTRRRVLEDDPLLNADLADWRNPSCPRPKVRLLGPVSVTAKGDLPDQSPRRSWNTEVVTYLATRPAGVTAERFGTDLWPGEPDIAGKTKVRQALMIVRKWLGEDPAGREYLPKGTTSAANGGVARYAIDGVLVDAELFRRLRLRGTARGAAGIHDLWAALDLAAGVPFDERRRGGYSWLADMPLDHEYMAMIVDTAHTVAAHHLSAGEPERASEAARVALRAGSSEDTPLLDLMTACDDMGRRAEGDEYARRIMTNHDAEIEEDLPPRTFQLLTARDRRVAG